MSPVAWATLNLHQDTPRLHWDQYLSLPHFLSLSSLLRVALEKISYTWLFRINLLKPKHQLWPLHPSLALQTLFYSSSLHCRSSPQPLIHLRLQFCSIINPEDFQNCLQHIQISYQRLFWIWLISLLILSRFAWILDPLILLIDTFQSVPDLSISDPDLLFSEFFIIGSYLSQFSSDLLGSWTLLIYSFRAFNRFNNHRIPSSG